MTDASSTLPTRQNRRYPPMNMAMGIVAPDSENAPRTFRQRVHHHQRQHRQQNHHDGENRHHGDVTRGGIHFLLHHLAERFSVAPQRAEQNHKILHRAAEHHADQNPQACPADNRIAPPAPARPAAPARRWPRNDGRRRSICSSSRNPCRRRALRRAWRGGRSAPARARRSIWNKSGSRWRKCKARR